VLSVTCPSVTLCFATAFTDLPGKVGDLPRQVGAVLRTVDGGRTWATYTLPKADGVGESISCPTTRRCIVVGGVGPCIDDFVRRMDLMTGSDGDRLRPAQYDCKGRGWLFATADGGRSWRREINRTLPAYAVRGADLLTVACPTPTQCYAGGYGIWVRSTHGGRAWSVTTPSITIPVASPAPAASADFIRSLSCTGLSTCWGLAGQLGDYNGIPVRTTDGGRSWQSVAGNVPTLGPDAGSGGLLSLTCPRPNRCFAVGHGGLIMSYSP
jgi:photosystem II stability/assembly factor-like uncharacterized protein